MPPSPIILRVTLLSLLLSIVNVLAATPTTNITFTFLDPVFVGIPYAVTWHREAIDPAKFYVQSFSIGGVVPLVPSDTVLVDSKGELSGDVKFTQCTAGRRAVKALDASNEVQVLAESVQYSVKSNSPMANCPSNPTPNSPAPTPNSVPSLGPQAKNAPSKSTFSDTTPSSEPSISQQAANFPSKSVTNSTTSIVLLTPSGGQNSNTFPPSQPKQSVEVVSDVKLGTGAIVGISVAIGVVVVVALLVMGILFWRRNKAQREQRKQEAIIPYDVGAMVTQGDISTDSLIPPHPVFPSKKTSSITSDTTSTHSLARRLADLELNLQRNQMAVSGGLAELRGAIGELRDDPHSAFGQDDVSPPAYHPNGS